MDYSSICFSILPSKESQVIPNMLISFENSTLNYVSEKYTKTLSSTSSIVTCIQCEFKLNNNKSQTVVYGTINGEIGVGYLDKSLKFTHKLITTKDEIVNYGGIVSIEVDPYSEDYVLIGCDNGYILFYDIVKSNKIMTFEKSRNGLRTIIWSYNEPGQFITSNNYSGDLYIWSIASTTPLSSFHVDNSCIISLASNKYTTTFVAATKYINLIFNIYYLNREGCIVLYNYKKRVVTYKSQLAHTETIYDVKFNPIDCMSFATCSYDGTIRLWDTETKVCQKTLINKEHFFYYSLSWSERGDKIVVSDNMGNLHIWDVALGKLLKTITLDKNVLLFIFIN